MSNLESLLRTIRESTADEALKRELSNAIIRGGTPDPRAEWKKVSADISEQLNNLQSRKNRRAVFIRPYTDAYEACLKKMVVACRNSYDKGTAFHDCVPRATQWQSWAPPKVRAALIAGFAEAYAAAGTRGLRIIPFADSKTRRENERRIKNAKEYITATSRVAAAGNTPYLALQLAACHMASVAISRYEQRTPPPHPYEDPAPTNWRHWLDSNMRARLRAADDAPQAISAEGLDHFYRPDAATVKAVQEYDPTKGAHIDDKDYDPTEATVNGQPVWDMPETAVPDYDPLSPTGGSF